MTNIVHLEPLTESEHRSYIEIGSKAYNQHYRHIWKNRDSSPYLEGSFTIAALENEEKDQNTSLFLIKSLGEVIGILKFTINRELHPYSEMEALYIDKIYILNEHTGKGIGKKVVQFVLLRAKELGKKAIWLDSMQIGPALQFYLGNDFVIHGKTLHPSPEVHDQERPMFILKRAI